MPSKITSVTNQKIKYLVRLRDAKQRKHDGVTIVEGQRELSRAMDANIQFESIYFSGNEYREIIEQNVKADIYEVLEEVFAKVAYGNHHKGILGICQTPSVNLSDLPKKKHPLYVVIEQVEKPGNIGAILRTCDGAHVDAVIVTDPKTDLFNPNVIRASLGTIFSVPVVVADNDLVLNFLRERKVQIMASSPDAKESYFNINLTEGIAIMMGSEDKGLTQFWLDMADVKVKIPMLGKADSLNVSTSTAVLVYEAVRQRSEK